MALTMSVLLWLLDVRVFEKLFSMMLHLTLDSKGILASIVLSLTGVMSGVIPGVQQPGDFLMSIDYLA